MKPLDNFSPEQVKQITGFFFDIDDTFSLDSKILPQAYTALWKLKEAGLKIVPITGRPAGWCDHIARMWPVDAVVGENGAFFFWCDPKSGKFKSRFFDSQKIREQKRTRLEAIKKKILSEVPGAGIASDQNYREADLAIDFCEDVPLLDDRQIQKICRIFEQEGATYKISSIHVNGWFGEYSKLDMTRTMVLERWGIDLDHCRSQYVFCGDSPNDEPMFEYFPNAVGVNNVLKFKDRLQHKPKYLANGEGSIGFAQIAGHILKHL